MISFSTDKQRDKVDAEWMSRPVGDRQPLALVLISMEQSLTFAYRLKRKLLSGPIFGGAYTRTIILPIIREDGDYFEYSKNSITTSQNHGVALVDDYFRMKKYFKSGSEKLPSFALQVIKAFDLSKYSEVTKNENEEIINYLPTKSFKIIDFWDVYPDDYLETWIKDKIVIIGYLGYNDNHLPDILDNNDSHATPIGKIFGPVIIANQIQTLLNNRIQELSKPIIFCLALIILFTSFFLISKIKSNKRWLIILIPNLVLVLLIGTLSFITILTLDKYSFFISIELITISLLLGFQAGIISKLCDD